MAWQGRVDDRFGVFARRWSDGAWAETGLGERGCGLQRLGPDPRRDGDGMAYAWSEYSTGSYAVALRQVGADGVAGWSAGSPVAATTRCTPASPRPPTAGCGARST